MKTNLLKKQFLLLFFLVSTSIFNGLLAQGTTKTAEQWIAIAKSGKKDLTNANLIGANLSQVNLSGADLSGANLSGANLICAAHALFLSRRAVKKRSSGMRTMLSKAPVNRITSA